MRHDSCLVKVFTNSVKSHYSTTSAKYVANFSHFKTLTTVFLIWASLLHTVWGLNPAARLIYCQSACLCLVLMIASTVKASGCIWFYIFTTSIHLIMYLKKFFLIWGLWSRVYFTTLSLCLTHQKCIATNFHCVNKNIALPTHRQKYVMIRTIIMLKDTSSKHQVQENMSIQQGLETYCEICLFHQTTLTCFSQAVLNIHLNLNLNLNLNLILILI